MFISSCQPTRSIPIASEKSNPNYYTKFSSNKERLVALLTGSFVQRAYSTKHNATKTWLVNDNQDSIILLSVQVGEPNKHGYWIYQYQYMTHLVDEPFYKALIHVEQIDRDTFYLTNHRPSKVYTLAEVMSVDFDKDMVFENLEKGKTRIYIRNPESRLQFAGYSPIALRQVANGDGPNELYLQEQLDLTPEQLRMKLIQYESLDAKEPKKTADAVTVFWRLGSVPGWAP